MNRKTDIVVIGAGMAGVCTALHLQRRGFSVELVDRCGAGHETSYGNAGIIETSYVLPFDLPSLAHWPRILLNLDPAVRFHYADLPKLLPWIANFCWQSRDAKRRYNGQLLQPLITCALDEHLVLMQGTSAVRHLSRHGRVKLHRSATSFAAATLERAVAQEWGVPFDVMDAADFSAIEPCLNPLYHKAVRWTGSARLTNPGAVVADYADRFVGDGGTLTRADVRSLTQSAGDGWIVHTQNGDLHAGQIVLCAGPWAQEMLKPLGYDFPLCAKRGYHRHYNSTNGASLSHAIVDADIGYLICPMEQGFRLISGIEFADLHAPPSPKQMEQILPFARQLFPLGDAVESESWFGSRPCFSDSLPVIGPAPRHRGLWLNIGHGHSGITIGASAGRLLAEMLRGDTVFCDPAPYRAERFKGA